ncbi:hypothetical protein Tco_1192030 [Tanacetum coccineum]
MSQSPKKLLIDDQLVPVSRQYEVSKANKKVYLINLPCMTASKIIGEILHRHSLCYALNASASVPLIYMQQMWNTLQLADSKEEFKFTIDEEEVTFLMNDLRTVLKLPQATANNHAEFVEAPEFETMIKIMGIDQPPLAIMQMLYCIINNVHVDYVALLWEGLYFQLVPYMHFTKLIIDHILTTHHDIPKRLNEPHYLVAHDDVV